MTSDHRTYLLWSFMSGDPRRSAAMRRGDKMAVTAALVKELRDKTGAGMMDCKKA